ncbi:nucleotidyltransferase [Fictibacillus phosphorivorans]|uniref:nucleotidyltransferase n=1 Tax=Fictibacillus phosphorivorans TaxID=1221500 RepID=UPI00203BDE59|nr:nucleotidyltransferase [Fictibacillus phosphorivorans]MCM3717273.1 nucleotidyltransferase [Fictibacillus phosphorivorans]MCM3774960.1 nucleotidyltransferase [Fictibacillus phosphorivorans]
MKATGVVVEYNPFHNGHYYHLQESRNVTQADCVIAVMSGNFLQRGEPALLSKWKRTKMALLGGADLVIELPYAYATSYAPRFAFGSIFLLQAAGADSFCFGSESGDVSVFHETLDLVNSQDQDFQAYVSEFIAQGLSYPTAAARAFEQLKRPLPLDLSKPNNILGFEYIRASRELGSAIQPFTIKRKNANYHDVLLGKGDIASATAIREAVFSHDIEKAASYIPDYTSNILKVEKKEKGTLMSWERLYPLLRYQLLSSSPSEINKFYEIEEGLEFRMIEAMKEAEDFQSFMSRLKTKRYTWTRLQRACLHVLNKIQKEDMHQILDAPPKYLRVLGMTETGREYLSSVKKSLELPLVTTVSKHDFEGLKMEAKTSLVYAQGAVLNGSLAEKEEYNTPPVMIK